MSADSKIEWTDATWNPVRGCTKVSPGCRFCYAETFAERWRGIPGHPYERGFDFRLVPDKLDMPLRKKKPTTYFVNSMSDLFHKDVPDEYIAAVFGVIAACQRHRFIILTKRAERLPEWFDRMSRPGRAGDRQSAMHEAVKHYMGYDNPRRPAVNETRWPLPNVWLGVSVESQEYADARIPHLLRTPAAVRFLSCEPLLGPVDLRMRADKREPFRRMRMDEGSWGIDWCIVGGESGAGARPMRLEWARAIVEQCKAAGVKVFCKQWGSKPIGGDGQLIKLRSKKGGDPSEWTGEWPREFPDAA